MATGTEADAARLDDGSSTRDVSGGRLLLLALVALIAAALVSMATGSTGIRLTALPQAFASAFGSSSDAEHARAALVLLDLRLPRTLLAIFVGGALAVAGAMMQGLFRNHSPIQVLSASRRARHWPLSSSSCSETRIWEAGTR
jgi:ABC-type enterobactin transport system permease subunit